MNREISRESVKTRKAVELLNEIERLGGENEFRMAQIHLHGLRRSIEDAIAVDPEAVGITSAEQMKEAVETQYEDLSVIHLKAIISILRRKAGYVSLAGKYWVHRAVFTFGAWAVLSAVMIPVCLALTFSAMAWGWLFGLAGVVVSFGLGYLIHRNVRG